MADETQKLSTARDLTEQVMGTADTNEPAHKLASALHLVLEVMLSAPPAPKPEDLRAAYEAANKLGPAPGTVAARDAADAASSGGGIIEAAPPPTVASVPPGSYEPPRNEDGTAAAAQTYAAPSIYEPLRKDDGTPAG